MSNDIKLDPARVSAAKSRARTEIRSARLSERAALASRERAKKLAEVWGFYVYHDEIGDEPCGIYTNGNETGHPCRRPKGHPDDVVGHY